MTTSPTNESSSGRTLTRRQTRQSTAAAAAASNPSPHHFFDDPSTANYTFPLPAAPPIQTSFADLTRQQQQQQQQRTPATRRAGGGAHLYSAADPSSIEIHSVSSSLTSPPSIIGGGVYARSSSSPVPNGNYVVGGNVARASSAPSPPPPGAAGSAGPGGAGGVSAEYLQRSRNRSVLATVKNALRDKAVVVEGGIYTAESREPSRRQHLHDQLKMARQLRSIFEAAATTAENPSTTLQQRRELFDQNTTNMKRLVSLTEAVRGRYVPQSYDEYDLFEEKRKKQREEKLQTAKRILKLHLKDMARERTPHLFAEEDERRRREELVAAIQNGEDIGDEEIDDDDDDDVDDDDDDDDYEDSAYGNSSAVNVATPSSTGDRASESKYYESSDSTSSSSDSDASSIENLPVKALQSSSKRKRRKRKKKMAKLAAARAAAVAAGSPLASSYSSPSAKQQPPASKKRKKKKNIISSSALPSRAMSGTAFLSHASSTTMDYSVDGSAVGGTVGEESKVGGGEAPHFATAAAAASAALHVPPSSTTASIQGEDVSVIDDTTSEVINFDPPIKCHYCRTLTSTYRKCHYIHKNGKICNRSFCQSCLETKYPKIATLNSVSGKILDEVDYNLSIGQRDGGWHCPVCLGECDCKTCTSYRERKRARAEAAAIAKGGGGGGTSAAAAAAKAASPSAASAGGGDDAKQSAQKASASSPTTTTSSPAATAAAPAPTPSPAPKKKKRRSIQSRKCHDCKKPSAEHRRCHFWFMNGTKCGKIYCRKCLESKYGLEKDTFGDLTSDADWHCPSCLGTCECKPCIKARERSEKRSATAMDRRSTTRTSAGFYSF